MNGATNITAYQLAIPMTPPVNNARTIARRLTTHLEGKNDAHFQHYGALAAKADFQAIER